MTPSNFPGRKNARRTKALGLASRKKNREAAEIEAANLLAKIIPQHTAEGIRTKKDRSARASFRGGRS